MSRKDLTRSPLTSVHVRWSPSAGQLAASCSNDLQSFTFDPVTLLPSSLDEHDLCAVALAAALENSGQATELIVPTGLLSLRARAFTRLPETGWRSVRVGQRRLRIDARLADGKFIVVSTVTDQTRRGPFVLDVPSRFLHPTDRARLVSNRNRQRMIADVAAVALPCISLVTTPVAGGWLSLATSDPIAAELCAISLAERFFDSEVEMQAPWEDPTIQQATELELGARIPQDITFVYENRGDIPRVTQLMLERLCERLGLPGVALDEKPG